MLVSRIEQGEVAMEQPSWKLKVSPNLPPSSFMRRWLFSYISMVKFIIINVLLEITYKPLDLLIGPSSTPQGP